jgi:hypothetical protein
VLDAVHRSQITGPINYQLSLMLQELLTANELLELGKFRPVIDRVYLMEQIVEAHRYVDQGHK